MGKKKQGEMSSEEQKIQICEMRAALARSGYLVEARVAEKLRSRQLTVLANVPFVDPITGKTRESDFRAALDARISGNVVGLTLLGECVRSPQPIVFIVTPRPASMSPPARRGTTFTGNTGARAPVVKVAA